MTDARLHPLVAEASEPGLRRHRVDHRLDAARDAVSIRVAGIGQGHDRAFTHRLQQTKADELRRDALWRVIDESEGPVAEGDADHITEAFASAPPG